MRINKVRIISSSITHAKLQTAHVILKKFFFYFITLLNACKYNFTNQMIPKDKTTLNFVDFAFFPVWREKKNYYYACFQ